jgi:prophage regulatory protein
MSGTTIDRRKDSLLRLRAVRQRTGLSPSTIVRREAAGTFPRRVKIGENSVAWYQSDVEDFIADPLRYRVAGEAA